MKSRLSYIEKSADILSKGVYKMCKEVFSPGGCGRALDAKTLKEVCGVVKETAAIVTGLDKKTDTEESVVRVVFEDTEGYCE